MWKDYGWYSAVCAWADRFELPTGTFHKVGKLSDSSLLRIMQRHHLTQTPRHMSYALQGMVEYTGSIHVSPPWSYGSSLCLSFPAEDTAWVRSEHWEYLCRWVLYMARYCPWAPISSTAVLRPQEASRFFLLVHLANRAWQTAWRRPRHLWLAEDRRNCVLLSK